MIELSPNGAVMLYLALTVALILGFWVYHHLKGRNKIIRPDEQKLFVCEYCHFMYLEEPLKGVTKCPQCHSYNKNNLFS